MKDVITSLVTTFERIIASPKSDELFTAPSRTAYMQEEMKIEDVTVKKTSALAQALMKAVCSNRGCGTSEGRAVLCKDPCDQRVTGGPNSVYSDS